MGSVCHTVCKLALKMEVYTNRARIEGYNDRQGRASDEARAGLHSGVAGGSQVKLFSKSGAEGLTRSTAIRPQVKFMILPELLKHSPAFGKVQSMRKKASDKDSSKAKPFKKKKV